MEKRQNKLYLLDKKKKEQETTQKKNKKLKVCSISTMYFTTKIVNKHKKQNQKKNKKKYCRTNSTKSNERKTKDFFL